MAVVVMHAVASMDGYIADTDDEVGPLFEWYFNGDVDIVDDGPFKVSKASADYVRTMWQSIGTTVIGRHLFDLTNGWEGRPPAGEHLVVVSHRPKPDGWHPEASCLSSMMWQRPSPRQKSSLARVSSPWRRAMSVGRPWRWASWTR